MIYYQWADSHVRAGPNGGMVDAASQALNRLIYCSGEPLDDRPRRPQPYIRSEDFYDPYGIY